MHSLGVEAQLLLAGVIFLIVALGRVVLIHQGPFAEKRKALPLQRIVVAADLDDRLLAAEQSGGLLARVSLEVVDAARLGLLLHHLDTIILDQQVAVDAIVSEVALLDGLADHGVELVLASLVFGHLAVDDHEHRGVGLDDLLHVGVGLLHLLQVGGLEHLMLERGVHVGMRVQ